MEDNGEMATPEMKGDKDTQEVDLDNVFVASGCESPPIRYTDTARMAWGKIMGSMRPIAHSNPNFSPEKDEEIVKKLNSCPRLRFLNSCC